MNYKYSTQGQRLCFTKNTKIIGAPEFALPIMAKFARSKAENEISTIKVHQTVPAEASALVSGYIQNDEGFIIKAEGNEINIYAQSLRGKSNGLMTFLHLLDKEGYFDRSILWDYPISPLRGIKLMMPAKNEINDFKAFIDNMVYFRHNTIMLEIGAAMEFKNHPEINEGWEEYAAFMSEYSGKSIDMQEHTFNWRKNSIHTNNGGGSFLSQQQVKEDIIAYCEERGIEIIPEMPSTSHCDYLLTRHHELAERQEDPYPDTFCPSNPDSYKLLFEVLDEVIDVFKPRILNIGHDEYYSINVCDRCRKRLASGAEIFAEDVKKIHGYLTAKGVRTMIWCDKILNVLAYNGLNFGGAVCHFYPPATGEIIGIPSTYKARDMIPKDILCLNWMWSFGPKYDEDLREFNVAFGNFRGANIRNYISRTGKNGVGGMLSNWGGQAKSYLKRNGIYLNMAYNDRLYWDATYDDNSDAEFEKTIDQTFDRLYSYNLCPADIEGKSLIEVVHTTDKLIEFRGFADGVYAEGKEYHDTYYMGDYVITYADGSTAKLEVLLGENIANRDIEWYGKTIAAKASDGEPGIQETRIDPLLSELAFTAKPIYIDGRVYTKTSFENPHPEKEISEIKFVAKPEANFTVETYSIKEL